MPSYGLSPFGWGALPKYFSDPRRPDLAVTAFLSRLRGQRGPGAFPGVVPHCAGPASSGVRDGRFSGVYPIGPALGVKRMRAAGHARPQPTKMTRMPKAPLGPTKRRWNPTEKQTPSPIVIIARVAKKSRKTFLFCKIMFPAHFRGKATSQTNRARCNTLL